MGRYVVEAYEYETSAHMGNFYREIGEELVYVSRNGFRVVDVNLGKIIQGEFDTRSDAEAFIAKKLTKKGKKVNNRIAKIEHKISKLKFKLQMLEDELIDLESYDWNGG